jgi:DNA-binding SARP family transcriptional activator
MTSLQIRLFGRFGISHDGTPLIGLDSRKSRELLAYLLLYRDRPHTRESLINVLWETASIAQAKKYLRQTLWQLQTALPAGPDPLLLIDADWIQINPVASFELDVAVLEQAYLRVQGKRGSELVHQQEQELHDATRIYSDDLLQGWYHDWCMFERERLQLMYLAILDKLLSCCETHHKYDAGLVYGMDILRCDRTRERAHRRLMRLHYLSGDRAAAIRQYQNCVAALAEELDVQPSQRTEALIREIRSDEVSARPGELPAAEPSLSHTTLSDILTRLIQLQRSVADIQATLTET